MPSTIAYAAHSYADEWLSVDRPAREVFRRPETASEEVQLTQLEKFARAYGIGRNFKTLDTGENHLKPALHALLGVSYESDPNETYLALFDELKRVYGVQLWSATSKFLWLRFGSPFRLWDQYADKWLGKMGNDRNWYAEYCARWKVSYENHAVEVREACGRLLPVADTFSPNEEDVRDLQKSLTEEWFHERVFDHYISFAEGPELTVSLQATG
jgi:hypothetical protein